MKTNLCDGAWEAIDANVLPRDAAWDAIKHESHPTQELYSSNTYRNNTHAISMQGPVQLVVTRDIKARDEITSTYGWDHWSRMTS